MSATTCRSCGAPVIWTMTERGSAMPVDADPVPDGNVTLSEPVTGWRNPPAFDSPAWDKPLATVDAGPSLLDEPGLLRYRSHFATCPNAAAWRKKR